MDMIGILQSQLRFFAVRESDLVGLVIAGKVLIRPFSVQTSGEHTEVVHFYADRRCVFKFTGDLDKLVRTAVIQIYVIRSAALGVSGDVDIAGKLERAALVYVHAATVTACRVTGDLAAPHVKGTAVDAYTAAISVRRATVYIAADYAVIHGKGAAAAHLYAALALIVGDGTAVHVERTGDRNAAGIAGDIAGIHVEYGVVAISAHKADTYSGLSFSMSNASAAVFIAVIKIKRSGILPVNVPDLDHRIIAVLDDAMAVEAQVDGRVCIDLPQTRKRYILGQHVVA